MPTQGKRAAKDGFEPARRLGCALTWVQPEEARRAAKVLPCEGWILLEVINEDFIQSLRHIDSIQNVWI